MSLLLVCSGGGHLRQLHQLADRLPLPEAERRERTWVTFDTGLSRSLLSGEDVRWATYAAPRDLPNIARNQVLAGRLVRERRWTAVVSTGSSLAVNFLPLAAALGLPAVFIETAARAEGPSMTGRILRWAPGVRTFTQYPSWADARFRYAGSIFEAFEAQPALVGAGAPRAARPITSAVVTLGTTESYGFRRMLEPLVGLLDGADVTWQTGSTDASGLGVDARAEVPYAEMVAAVERADVVVAHAGTGAALTALSAGRCPVLVPRLRRHDEHVDDHQEQIAADLHRRGLAIACRPEELTADVLAEAASRRVVPAATPPPLRFALA